MHEFSLAQGLMEQLSDLAAQHQAKTILNVRVSIGVMSGIVIDSFQFGFEILCKEKTLTTNSQLEITEVPGTDLVLTQVEME